MAQCSNCAKITRKKSCPIYGYLCKDCDNKKVRRTIVLNKEQLSDEVRKMYIWMANESTIHNNSVMKKKINSTIRNLQLAYTGRCVSTR